MMVENTCQQMVGLQAHVKKKPSKSRKSIANPIACPSALVFALANMSSDLELVNVDSSSGMEDVSVVTNKRPFIQHEGKKIANNKAFFRGR